MKNWLLTLGLTLTTILTSATSYAQAKVMNPGEAKGQLVFLSAEDVRSESALYKSLNPISIPVFAELPMELSVVAGAITLSQQNLLSHVQLKSRARHTPNLDISELPGGLNNDLLKNFRSGDWVHLLLSSDGKILIEMTTEADAVAFTTAKKNLTPVKLKYDLSAKNVFRTSELSWVDFDKVGSKAANYAELAKALNTPERTVVRPGYAIPFYFYQQFIDTNPSIKAAIEQILHDPLMNKISKVSYREEKLKNLYNMILSKDNVVSPELISQLLTVFEKERTVDGLPKKMKLRSSTNSEDLPNFNGAGLYDSAAYKPTEKNKEKTSVEKVEALKETLRIVWASIWNLRAFEERAYFQIPHADVKMGMQVNPAYKGELANGVVVTKNVSKDPNLTGSGVYIEAQRGDTYSVVNPVASIKPEKILVTFDPLNPLNKDLYQIHILQRSNIADDNKTVMDHDNMNPVLPDQHSKDLVYLVLKAEQHFKPLLGKDKTDFSLDLEFKLSDEESVPQIYLKQSRPYID